MSTTRSTSLKKTPDDDRQRVLFPRYGLKFGLTVLRPMRRETSCFSLRYGICGGKGASETPRANVYYAARLYMARDDTCRIHSMPA